MSQENDPLDSLRRATGSLSRGRGVPEGADNLLHSRTGLALLLIFPIALVFTVIIGGYLYFTYQQIRTSRADEEFHVLNETVEAIRAELSATRFDMLNLLTGGGIAAFSTGEVQAANLVAVEETLRTRQSYDYIALLDIAGREILRVNYSDGEVRRLPDEQLGSHGDEDYFLRAVQQEDARVVGTSIRSEPTRAGTGTDRLMIYYSMPLFSAQGIQSVLLMAYRADRLIAIYEELARADAGDFWVVDAQGRIMASRAGNQPFRFIATSQSRDNLNALHPEVWSVLLTRSDPNVLISAGIVNHVRICGQLDCLSSTGLPAGGPAAASGGEQEWRLVSLLPRSELHPITLLGNEQGRWMPLTALLLLAGIVSVFCAWLLASTMASLRRNEMRLKRAHVLQNAFFERNPEIMFVKNLDGTFYLANEKCRQLAGVPETDLAGVDRGEIFPEDASSTMAEQDKQVVSAEEAMEFHTRWKRDGVVYHFKTLRFPMYDEDGELIAVGGIANDITDQVLSRHALMENERLLRTFIESAPDAVLISDDNARITLVNRQAELIFDLDREAMLDRTLFDLISGLKPTEFHSALEAGRGADGDEAFREALEAQGIGNNNRIFPVEFSLAPINTEEGSLVICLLRDVSEKALMETQLRQSQKMEAIGKLTGGMAHDFNNLLGIIIGNIALALRQVRTDERVKKRLDTAMKAADRGAELTKRMLAIARRQPLQPKPVAINGVIEELSQMLPQTLGSDIEMELQLETGLPPVLVDESGFEGMLLNLAINSRDAMPNGGHFIIRTDLKTQEDIERVLPQAQVRKKSYVHVAVSDTGTGMSEEALNRAFEPFFTTKEKGKGTGLGLAMIYGFVKQSHGYIVIDSKVAEGTSIHIFLPAGADTAVAGIEQRQGKPMSLPKEKSYTVLVVDDEEELLEIAQAYLEDMGLTVVTAATGAEALRVVEANKSIDLMITDVVMPGGLNGPGLAIKVREHIPDIEIIYASGFPSGVIQENAGVELDAPLVNKPYNWESLAAVVMQALVRAEEVE